MEICYKTIKQFEFISRIDKYASIALYRFYMSVFIRRTLYRPAACRPDTDNAVSAGFSPVDLISRVLVNYVVLLMHMMFSDIINFYGSECSKSHMQCDVCYINSHVFNLF